jgi:hypothetical protein
MLISIAAALLTTASAPEPLYEDTVYGRQMTVAEIKRDLVGNSLVWGEPGSRHARYIAPNGAFIGGGEGLLWHFRDYDNLFCVDSGDPATSGCVQLLRSGNQITFRRKDGLIELTATLEAAAPGPLAPTLVSSGCRGRYPAHLVHSARQRPRSKLT